MKKWLATFGLMVIFFMIPVIAESNQQGIGAGIEFTNEYSGHTTGTTDMSTEPSTSSSTEPTTTIPSTSGTKSVYLPQTSELKTGYLVLLGSLLLILGCAVYVFQSRQIPINSNKKS